MVKKKVLFFLPKGIGGAQKMTIVISNFLPRNLYEVKYIIVGKKKDKDMAYLIENKLDVEYLDIFNAWDFLTVRIVKILRKYKPDIVFSSLMYLNVRVILAAKIVGNIKTIVRNDNMLRIMRYDIILLMKLFYKMADIIIAQQEEMKADLIHGLNIDESKIVVRYNPVDKNDIIKKSLQISPYNDEDTVKYIWTGNFVNSGSKGQDVLVKAFALLKKKIPNAHLYFLGAFDENSSFFKEIKDFVNKQNLSNSVHFIGFQKNPYPWVKYADCFVLPSRIEGLPNALVDAMILSKPVVATTCIPMISRMVHDGYNGYLVPSEDYKTMADAMVKALYLRNFNMIYNPSTNRDFIELF